MIVCCLLLLCRACVRMRLRPLRTQGRASSLLLHPDKTLVLPCEFTAVYLVVCLQHSHKLKHNQCNYITFQHHKHSTKLYYFVYNTQPNIIII